MHRSSATLEANPSGERLAACGIAALQAANTLRTILETIPVGVVVTDAEGTICLANQAVRQVLGGPIGSNVYVPIPGCRVLQPDGTPFPSESSPLRRCLENGESFHDVEVLLRPAGGTERVLLVAANPERDYLGRVAGMVVVLQDITERKRAEDERDRLLAEVSLRRAQLEAIVDQAPAGILFVGAGDGAVITNREASRIFGHPVAPGDECQQCLGQVRHPDGRPVDVDDLPTSRALRGERVEGTDHLVVQASGATIPIRWSAAAIRGSHGEIIGCVSVLHDVSAIKQLERLRGEWTSMVAHDLRQPVAAVTLAAQLLRQNPGTAPGIQRWVEEIVGSSRRLDRMVADLLDESRIETGRLRLKLEPVDPAALVTASVARLARAYPERAIRFGQSGPIPTMDLDPGRLDQVLTNLVTNAAKYGDDGTEIVVELDARGDAVELTVTNHGPGILPDELPRLFDRFYRTPRAEAGGADGLGLGLYITRGIVEAHGGRIWAESTPGQTTRFRVSLPYR